MSDEQDVTLTHADTIVIPCTERALRVADRIGSQDWASQKMVAENRACINRTSLNEEMSRYVGQMIDEAFPGYDAMLAAQAQPGSAGELTELARQIMAALDKQQEYFGFNYLANPQHKNGLLRECQGLEAALRKRCQEIVGPENGSRRQSSLFGEEDASATSDTSDKGKPYQTR